MRTSIIWSAVTILLLAASMAATPALPDQASLIAADQDDDDNRGHGNDSDGDDEDNPGQGVGRNDDEDDDDNGDGSTNINVVNAGEYTVEVACELDAEANQTECAFSGVAPEGGKDISHICLLYTSDAA